MALLLSQFLPYGLATLYFGPYIAARREMSIITASYVLSTGTGRRRIFLDVCIFLNKDIIRCIRA